MMKERRPEVLYLTPYYRSRRGNATTAKRMQKHLIEAGANVRVYAYEEEEDDPIQKAIEKADLVHALHVKRTAAWLRNADVTLTKPLILTSGGTDINVDLYDNRKKQTMEKLLKQAEALTVFTEDARDKVLQQFPDMTNKIHVIPQSVAIPEFENDARFHLPEGTPKILLPAGLRPVKDVLYAVEAVDRLRSVYPDIQFLLVGEVLDSEVENAVREMEKRHDWFTYHKPVAPEQMIHLYQWADVVLNTSQSEGQPISLLEGMAAGKPALARDIPGNRSVVQHGYNGYLFSTPSRFAAQLVNLIENKDRYKRLARQAVVSVREQHNPAHEAAAYLQLYNKIAEASYI